MPRHCLCRPPGRGGAGHRLQKPCPKLRRRCLQVLQASTECARAGLEGLCRISRCCGHGLNRVGCHRDRSILGLHQALPPHARALPPLARTPGECRCAPMAAAAAGASPCCTQEHGRDCSREAGLREALAPEDGLVCDGSDLERCWLRHQRPHPDRARSQRMAQAPCFFVASGRLRHSEVQLVTAGPEATCGHQRGSHKAGRGRLADWRHPLGQCSGVRWGELQGLWQGKRAISVPAWAKTA
mmetsp:Transcript_15630/g.49423  ORF Transcript_15630/g.49423 Transcript_15630/m.49423 type:complete len:242 (-) Transcript_15630:3-728(-)